MSKTGLYVLALVVVLVAGCGGGPTEADYEFGRIDVYVRDSANQPVNGVTVRMDRSNGTTEDAGGLTGSVGVPGYFFFLKTSGEYRIVITPPAGYELAPGQSASAPVTFTRNQTRTVNFVLRQV
jgi:hypothetical protein